MIKMVSVKLKLMAEKSENQARAEPAAIPRSYLLWMSFLGLFPYQADTKSYRDCRIHCVKIIWSIILFLGLFIFILIDFTQYFVHHYAGKLYSVDFFTLIILVYRWWHLGLVCEFIFKMTRDGADLAKFFHEIAIHLNKRNVLYCSGHRKTITLIALNMTIIGLCALGYCFAFQWGTRTFISSRPHWTDMVPIELYGEMKAPQWMLLCAVIGAGVYSSVLVQAMDFTGTMCITALGHGFRNIHSHLIKILQNGTTETGEAVLAIRKLNQEHLLLTKLVEKFNGHFSCALFKLMIRDLLAFLTGAALMFKFSSRRDQEDPNFAENRYSNEILEPTVWALLLINLMGSFIRIVSFVWMSDQIVRPAAILPLRGSWVFKRSWVFSNARQALLSLKTLRSISGQEDNRCVRVACAEFSRRVRKNPSVVSVYDTIPTNRPYVTAVLGGMFTYLVVIYQVHDQKRDIDDLLGNKEGENLIRALLDSAAANKSDFTGTEM